MCGIAGVVYFNKKKRNSSLLNGIIKDLRHRGPDGIGKNFNEKVQLGMTRLSIIDLSGGMQPLYNEDKSIEVMGNGEIYNYIELQKKIIKKGHKLRTGSDIETAAHLYEDYGINSVKYLRGMFALAIHDKNRGKLFLTRDRFGEKPIYYYKGDNLFVFASELKALLNFKEIDKNLNFEAIDSYFHHYFIPEPNTPFKNIRKLEAGSFLELNLGTQTIDIEKYYNFSEISQIISGDLSAKILSTLEESCKLTLRSDVPVGIALSGGLDSGSILALSAPFYKEKMKAFTVGYEGTPKNDERRWASYLANKFNIEQHFDEIKTDEFVRDFPKLVYDADDPIADIAGYAIYRVAKMAHKENIKVLLSGLGGDELFWGYPWVRKATNENIINRDKSPVFYEKVTAYKNAKLIIRNLYTHDFKREVKGNWINQSKPIKNHFKAIRFSMDEIRDKWLVSNCIALNDRLAMASSVELRSPLLDYKLAELAYSSKENVSAYSMGNKYFLRKALKGILPDEYLNLPKRGFTPPVFKWLKALIEKNINLLNNGELINQGIISEQKLVILTKIWRILPVYWYMIYQLIVLEMWMRLFLKNEKLY